ncbi:MAG: prenylated flavin chaperone LpdD [Candidatus Thorarchaeota archaeon]|jgi:hypothetical protein
MKFEKEAGRHTIFLDVKEIGKDLLIAIYGGDAHHIGGVAVAYPTQSHYRDATTVSVSTMTLPGHKDYVIVTVGIHYDNATKKDIDEIISVVDVLVQDAISYYQKAE